MKKVIRATFSKDSLRCFIVTQEFEQFQVWCLSSSMDGPPTLVRTFPVPVMCTWKVSNEIRAAASSYARVLGSVDEHQYNRELERAHAGDQISQT